ncbi:MAG: Flp pilus assembly pilin Flp [Pseudohongiellaceae bacterium]|jgi:Flp pilus assembly pilin Flp
MKSRLHQLGQGMTEYIIIVALIAVAAITVYGFFGDTVRGQVGAMTASLGGTDSSASEKAAATASGNAGKEGGAEAKNLGTFSDGTAVAK